MLYLFFFKPLRDHLRGFLIAAWAGDKIAEFSFPEISFHFPLRPWFFFVSPAYAGKSRECARGLTRARNHPRVCGEKSSLSRKETTTSGSPPRMRGKVKQCLLEMSEIGITPAYAGKSVSRSCALQQSRDHPRVCGEKAPFRYCITCSSGSPPRMRGKVSECFCGLVSYGITPAYAGKSRHFSGLRRCPRDHPRVCGEKFMLPCLFIIILGSPPRMRGKGKVGPFPALHSGITPAYAGKRGAL